MTNRSKITAVKFLCAMAMDLSAAILCRFASKDINVLRAIEISILIVGAFMTLILLASWAPGIFVIDSDSDVILNATWFLLEIVALIIGSGVTVSPFVLLILLSGTIPRGHGARKIELAALGVSTGIAALAVGLYAYFGNIMTTGASLHSSFIFAILPGYLFITACLAYGLIVLIARRHD